MYNFWLFEGPWGPFNDQTGPILFPSYPSTHIYVHVKTEAIWQQLFTFNIQNMNKISLFSYLGGPGGPIRQTQGCQFVMEVGPFDSADMYNKG